MARKPESSSETPQDNPANDCVPESADNSVESQFAYESELSRKEMIAYSSGAVTEVIMGNILVGLAMYIYNLGFGVDIRLISVALGIPRLWDAFSDPIIANISDNAHTRFGRRKPFILVGTLFTALFCVLLWVPPTTLSEKGYFWYFLVMALAYYTAYTVFTIPYHAVGPELTGDFKKRNQLMSYKNFMMSFGATLFLPWAYLLCRVIGRLVQENPSLEKYYSIFAFGRSPHGVEYEVAGVRIVGLIYAILMIIFIIPPIVACKERFANANKEKISIIKAMIYTFKNKPFVIVCLMITTTMIGTYLVSQMGGYLNLAYVFNMDKDGMAKMIVYYTIINGAVSMAVIPLICHLITRIGKMKTLIAGLTLTILSYLSTWFIYNPSMPYIQLLHPLIGAPGMACLWLVISILVADICDYDELTTGLRREAMYTAIFGWCMKASVAGGTILAGFMVSWTGFGVKLDSQTAQTIMKMRLSFMLVPVIFLIIAIYMMSKYPLDRKKMEHIQAQLIENRKKAK